MHAVDVTLFHWINGWSDSVAPLFDFLSEATKTAPGRIGLGLIAVALIAAHARTRRATLLALVAFLIANGMTDLLKRFLPSPRPCVELLPNVVSHGVGFLQSAGTASAHAANTAAIALVMTYYLGYWGLLPIAISLFTGVARIYVGVHYPSQVLLGWLCGLAAGGLVIAGYRLNASRRK